MIGEEGALIQTPRKRQRKWKQKEAKEMERTYFYRYFYFISFYALVSSFLSYILPF